MGDFKKYVKDLLSTRGGKLILAALAIGAALLLACSFMSGEEKKSEEDNLAVYKAELEQSLAEFCSSVEGAGRCKVMVSFSSGESLEYKGGNLISSTPPKVLGVTVLCRGGDKDKVRADVTELVSSLFDIGKNRVCVLKLS